MQKLIKSIAWLVAFGTLSVSAGEKVDKEISAKANGRIIIENMRGDVEIIGWQQDKVKVTGSIDDEAENFIFQDNGNHVEILVEMPKKRNNKRWKGKGSDLSIYVPMTSHIKFAGVSTDVDVSDISKTVEIHTVSGDIEAKKLASRIELVSVSGHIKTRELTGKVRLSTVSGDIDDKASDGSLFLKSISGDIRCQSKANDVATSVVSGDVDLDLARIDDLAMKSVSGKLSVAMTLNDNASTKFSSVSGAINLAFEDDVNASFSINSNAGGRITNNLTNDKVIKAKYGPSSKLYFEKGDGGALVKISTLSGRVKISD